MNNNIVRIFERNRFERLLAGQGAYLVYKSVGDMRLVVMQSNIDDFKGFENLEMINRIRIDK